jgi:hypothetical protein
MKCYASLLGVQKLRSQCGRGLAKSHASVLEGGGAAVHLDDAGDTGHVHVNNGTIYCKGKSADSEDCQP